MLLIIAVIGMLATVALVVLPLAGLGGAAAPTAHGQGMAAERIDTGGSPAMPIRRVPEADPGPGSGQRLAAVAAVIADLDTFWAQALPAESGTASTPLSGGVVAVDSASSAGAAMCLSSASQLVGNAYYCPGNDGIVYDSAALVPVLLDHYGAGGLVASFAHEYGHAIQARIGPTQDQRAAEPKRYPSLLIEAQADCMAGAFLAWVSAGSAPHLHIPHASLLRAITPLLDFRDPVTVTSTDAAAHGLGMDRLESLLIGLREGSASCHRLTIDSMQPTLGQVPAPADGMRTPRFGSATAALTAAGSSIVEFAHAERAAPAGQDLAGISATDADLAIAAPFGQFAQATALALAVGRSEKGTSTGAACFTGAWVRSVFGHAAAGALGSWPADADEALDLVRSRTDATFDDVAAYADGFRHGLASC